MKAKVSNLVAKKPVPKHSKGHTSKAPQGKSGVAIIHMKVSVIIEIRIHLVSQLYEAVPG